MAVVKLKSFSNGLSAGGKIETPLQEMFWEAYYGSFTNKFGVHWVINYSKNDRTL